jgi:hypothetical protein
VSSISTKEPFSAALIRPREPSLVPNGLVSLIEAVHRVGAELFEDEWDGTERSAHSLGFLRIYFGQRLGCRNFTAGHFGGTRFEQPMPRPLTRCEIRAHNHRARRRALKRQKQRQPVK